MAPRSSTLEPRGKRLVDPKAIHIDPPTTLADLRKLRRRKDQVDEASLREGCAIRAALRTLSPDLLEEVKGLVCGTSWRLDYRAAQLKPRSKRGLSVIPHNTTLWSDDRYAVRLCDDMLTALACKRTKASRRHVAVWHGFCAITDPIEEMRVLFRAATNLGLTVDWSPAGAYLKLRTEALDKAMADTTFLRELLGMTNAPAAPAVPPFMPASEDTAPHGSPVDGC
jgi:hypothetical protein